jgi:hypothetical protein
VQRRSAIIKTRHKGWFKDITPEILDWGLRGEKKAHLLLLQIVRIKSHKKMVKTLWPISWLEDTKEGDDILARRAANHGCIVVKSR